MLSRRTRRTLLAAMPLGAFFILTALPCAAQVYLMVGSNANGGGIQRFDMTTGALIDTFVSGALLSDGARGFDFGPDGNLYVASRSDREIRKYDGKTGAFLSNFAGNTTGYSTLYRGVALFGPDGSLYVGGGYDNVIYRYNGVTGADYPSPGNTGAVFISGNGIVGGTGLVFGPTGDLFVSSEAYNTMNGAILRYDAKTGASKEFLIGAEFACLFYAS